MVGLIHYYVKLCIESDALKRTEMCGSQVELIRKVSTHLTYCSRKEAHNAVDAFFDEYDEMIKK